MGVRSWLSKIFWVLVFHAHTRLLAILGNFLFVPLKKGGLMNLITFTSFYVVATPLGGLIALTNAVTTSLVVKMCVVMATTPFAGFIQSCCCWLYLWRMDWACAAEIIRSRANNDKREAELIVPMSRQASLERQS